MNCQQCHKEIAEYSNFCYYCGARQNPNAAPSAAARPQKRLMRSSTDCKLGGVCGGIAEYLDVDSTIVRLIWVVLILFPFPLIPAVLGYFVAWLVIPQAPLPLPVEVSAQPAAPSAPSAPGSAQTA
ncbi:MAG: PspC domain-containing protein [Candidatus Acidiferrales bacterium]